CKKWSAIEDATLIDSFSSKRTIMRWIPRLPHQKMTLLLI
ncbi:Uncharacterized protein APZ42_008315, partial [Daphnia magna]